jgi:hypothetical protein
MPSPRDLVAHRAQAVPVERGARDDAVGERERGRPVPRLEPGGLEAIEVADRRRHVAAALPGVRDQGHQRLGGVEAAPDEQLEDVVQAGGVRPLGPDHRAQLVGQLGLAGAHPRPVAGHRVDLAVVGEHPERLGEAPVGQRVRRVALVEDGELALRPLVLEVEVEVGQVRPGGQSLVDDRPAGAGGDVHPDALGLGSPLGQAPGGVQPVLPLVLRQVRALDHAVPDRRHALAGARAQTVRVQGWAPPVRDAHAVLGQGGGELAARALVPLEEDGDRGPGPEDLARDLDHQPRAVAAPAVGVEAAAVAEAGESSDTELDDSVARGGAGRRHEAHATGGTVLRQLPRPRGARRQGEVGHQYRTGYPEGSRSL